jgi:hypothetical protein
LTDQDEVSKTGTSRRVMLAGAGAAAVGAALGAVPGCSNSDTFGQPAASPSTTSPTNLCRTDGRTLNEGEKQALLAQIHEGIPNAKVEFEDVLNIGIEGETPPDPKASPKERLRISLDRLNVNIHNQSFGMISASTGCISNPGGPSC